MPENKDDIDLDGWELTSAAILNRVDIASALITRGDDVNTSGTFIADETTIKDGWTPLLTLLF
tara:strand:- start:435 stop:623 length:189 start_codon:yes stop_codon:yes gene_type:complete